MLKQRCDLLFSVCVIIVVVGGRRRRRREKELKFDV
jgi:hypothetical protein